MKRFYYISKDMKRRNSWYRRLSVFGLGKNGLRLICYSRTYALDSCRGDDSEAFGALIEAGAIPRKWWMSSKTDWSAAGYFQGPVREHYAIRELAA